jgi:uncharacterized membrane protein YkoI
MASVVCALMLMGAAAVEAQYASDTRIRVQKDVYTSQGDIYFAPGTDADLAAARTAGEWYRFSGTTCSGVDQEELREATIESDLYVPGQMISPDSAKVIALCAVPGNIGSSDMEVNDQGRTEYEIDIVPNGKRTWTKVVIDARTGAVLSTKQFGGLRGLAGWVRESF